MASILERLKKVVAEQLDVDEKDVTPQTSFADDLGADSLDLVELITAVEEEFSSPDKKLEIADDDAEKLQSVQDAIDYLCDQGIAD
ncbi:MAG: acyl carrier protein [Chloroflexota bacterium]|nr:acyl carrier protein [Chloroflexota bacterium]